jgi:hypothetical protein
MTGGVSLGTVAAYAGLAASAYSIYSTATADKPEAPSAGQGNWFERLAAQQAPTLSDASAASPEVERRRRVAASRNLLNPTGGLGDTSSPGVAAKTLLGA